MSGTTTPPAAPQPVLTYHRRGGRPTSHAIHFARDNVQRKDFQRADLIFEGVDHAGPSFEARVFLNNAEATEATPRRPENGYAGSFHIFGHGSCFGDAGHCDVTDRGKAAYDLRGNHPLTPARKVLIITDALKQVLDRDGELHHVKVVPVAYGHPATGAADPEGFLKYDTVHLTTYD